MTSPSADQVRFVTNGGVRVAAVTAETMREIDRLAVHETGPNLFQMMENAGRSLALLALDVLGAHWPNSRVVVLAGAGGNGGGGICAARHLANRGVDITLVLSDPDRLGEVPATQRKVFSSTRGREGKPPTTPPDLILDALIGYGLREVPRGRTAELIAWADASGAPVVSLDVPSGMDATTGIRPGLSVQPTATLTLALPKTGLVVAVGRGDLWLADLGIPRATFERAGVAYVDPFGPHYRVRLTSL